MQARARRLADREQAGQARAAFEVGDDPADHVVRGRCDRHELARHVEPGLGKRLDDVREERRVDLAHVEPDAAATARRELRVDRAADLIARRELVDEALTVVVEQQAALATDRLRHQEALAARHPDHRGWVKLHELEVRELRTGCVRQQHARP